eukprot:scaffold525151_cov47-Prasinocladus_malaysianus.AAC.1
MYNGPVSDQRQISGPHRPYRVQLAQSVMKGRPAGLELWHHTCLMMSKTEDMEGIFEVNGAAIEASPSLTTGTKSAESSRSSAASPSRGFCVFGAPCNGR